MACSAGSSSRQAVHQVAQNVSRTGLPLKSARLTLLPESDQEVKPGAVPPTWATPPVTVAVLADLPIVIIATAVAVAMTTTSSGRASAHLGTGRVGGLSFRALPDSIIESEARRHLRARVLLSQPLEEKGDEHDRVRDRAGHPH